MLLPQSVLKGWLAMSMQQIMVRAVLADFATVVGSICRQYIEMMRKN